MRRSVEPCDKQSMKSVTSSKKSGKLRASVVANRISNFDGQASKKIAKEKLMKAMDKLKPEDFKQILRIV